MKEKEYKHNLLDSQNPFMEIYISNWCLEVTYQNEKQLFREITYHLATKN